MRYFIHLTYHGGSYVGWQIQDNGASIQAELEDKIATILRSEVRVSGCGRTDAGVHARAYCAHVDVEEDLCTHTDRLNRMLPQSILIKSIFPVPEDLHARFSAEERGYRYYVSKTKDPLRMGMVYHYHASNSIDEEKLDQAAKLLLNYNEFFPFCKSKSGVDHYKCCLRKSQWTETEYDFIYEISANRFLRGMVRLIVGMCLQVSIGRVPLTSVQQALDLQTSMDKSWAVPAHGLFLERIVYPEFTIQ